MSSAWRDLLEGRVLGVSSARKQIAQSAAHYVYVLCRSDGTPFYVGKGVRQRCFHHEAEARNTERLTHKLNLVRSLHRRGEAVSYCIESSFNLEADAHARERFLINLIGRHDQGRGPLTNQTDGGEGQSNPSKKSRERRRKSLWGDAEDEERRAVNKWFQSLCDVRSVPVKPLRKFKPERLYANRQSLGMSPRQSAALTASAIANHCLLHADARIPRRMNFDGTDLAIENGVSRDILSSGMASLADATVGAEIFRLSSAGLAYVISSLGRSTLESAGILTPDL